MSILDFILKKAAKKLSISVADIVAATGLSRTYIHRFFKQLVEQRALIKVGGTKSARYALPKNLKILKKSIRRLDVLLKNKNLDEDKIWFRIKDETSILDGTPENVNRILEYAFTEMLNNAIEHSRSVEIRVFIEKTDNAIRFQVRDKGIGIFENLIHTRHLRSVEEAIQDLLKGKQTTKPGEHSGEGIFFTRRIADIFVIESGSKKIFFDNTINDFSVFSKKPLIGTRVDFSIAADSNKNLSDVFKKYTSEEYEFSTTEVTVRLYKPGQIGGFVSRSQARRILTGLEKFKKVVLDFKGISAVGQGFVDEIFRVWKNKHPEILVTYINADEDVVFMIKRADV